MSKLVVLGYHNVTPTHRFPSATGAAGLGRQLRLLRTVAKVVPLESALATLAAGGSLPARAVAVTFDDGYRDNLTVAAPLLRSLGVPATIYLVPGLLSREVTAWWERLAWAVRGARVGSVEFEGAVLSLGGPDERAAALHAVERSVKRTDHATRTAVVEDLVGRLDPAGEFDRDLYLDWDGAREIVRAGWAVGSHTTAHAILARETAPAQQADLVSCRAALSENLSVEVPGLAYPNGERDDYDTDTIAAVAAAGHTHAVTTWGRTADTGRGPFEIGRTVVSTATPPWRLAARVLRAHATA